MLATSQKIALSQADVETIGSPDGFVTVRRSGRPPLRFLGELTLIETSHRIGTKLWYEINIYRRAKSGYVCEVKQFSKSASHNDRFNAEQCATVGEIVTYLENYSVKDDIVSDIDLKNEKKAMCDLVLEGIELRQHIHEAQLEFGHVASQIFDTLIEFDQSR